MRQLVIGDIHGCLTALKRLDEAVHFGADDLVVTLGDYVDRGPDSRGVIEFLIALRARCRLVTLRGNHEIMMLRAKEDPSVLDDWLACGGNRTLDSYGSKFVKAVLAKHWQFLEETLPYYETERDFFVHANAYPDCPLSEQPDYMLYWEGFGEPTLHQSGKRMICGHSSQKSGHPLSVGHAVCIDTWVYGFTGWLTCLDAGTGRYWQANQSGELRSDTLMLVE